MFFLIISTFFIAKNFYSFLLEISGFNEMSQDIRKIERIKNQKYFLKDERNGY